MANPTLLTTMHRIQFLAAVESARRQAEAAEDLRDTLVLWQQRLQPYFDADPECTMEQALHAYSEEH